MSGPTLDADLELAQRMADAADTIGLKHFRDRDLVVETKPDMTPVTAADKGIEAELRRMLTAERGGDAVLGEEYGLEGSSKRVWLIDPIDGTKNYVRGIPVFATLIALAVGDEPVVGVVSAPALGRRWWARRDGGAYLDGEQIRVSRVPALEDAQLSFNDMRSFARHGHGNAVTMLSRAVWRVRGFGDFWSHVLVAEGAVDVAVEPWVNPWDLAALQVIVEEAGGRFTDLDGNRGFGGGSALTTNGLLHDDVLALFNPTEDQLVGG